MAKGRLGRLLSAVLLCFWGVLTAMYVFFGPASWVLGLMYGVGSVAAFYWLGMRFPVLVSYADVRSPQSAAISEFVQAGVQTTDDPRTTSRTLARVLLWLVMIVFAGLATLFAVFTVTLALRDEMTSGLTGASIGCGLFAALTYVVWNLTRTVGSQ